MKTKIHNYFLCKKYPFLKSRNVWDGRFLGYAYTEYDQIPDGWRKAFGKQLLKDLKEALIEDKALKTFRFTQIKEKYGSLRLYTNFVTPNVEKVIEKYEKMSEEYCIYCGKPSTHFTKGWILFVCSDCYDKVFERQRATFPDDREYQEYKAACKI